MFKFILPVTAGITKKRYAWSHLHHLSEKFGFSPERTKLREETFLENILFRELDGTHMTRTRRMYTFTFFLDDVSGKDLIDELCTRDRKMARLLTDRTVLMCVDENLTSRAAHLLE